MIRPVANVLPPPFIPGLELCRLFYLEGVRPLLGEAYPDLRYAAARLGPGSEVLGFDTERSVDLTALRDRLHWYPDDMWRYLLASQWARIAQEEAFVGRTAEVGDELGSRLVTARLVRDVMRLCLLLARRYPPYSKWLGTAFAALPGTSAVATALDEALYTKDLVGRQAALCTAYEAVGDWQNRLGIAEPVAATRRPFHDRPYPVIDAARFATALLNRIEDPVLATLPPIGSIDQRVDSTHVLCRPDLAQVIMVAAYATSSRPKAGR